MADSIREKILQNLKTTLQGITTGAGYNYTVNLVERIRTTPVNHEVFPSVYIYEGKMDADLGPYNHVTKELPITLELWTESGGENPSVVLNKHLADIEKALMVDPHRGTTGGFANAIDTYYVGDQIFIEQGEEFSIGAYAFLTIKFRTRRTDPTSLEV